VNCGIGPRKPQPYRHFQRKSREYAFFFHGPASCARDVCDWTKQNFSPALTERRRQLSYYFRKPTIFVYTLIELYENIAGSFPPHL
jgi:hypothetical protein